MPSHQVPREAQPYPHPELTIQVGVGNGNRTIHLTGELDMATVPELDAVLRGAVIEAHELVVNVDRLTFIDSTGLRCILQCHEACRRAGIDFFLTDGSLATARLFEITGMRDRLPFIEAAA